MKTLALVSFLVGIVIFALLAGLLLPIGLDSLTNFTSTDSNVQTMVATVLPIMIAVALVLVVVSIATKQKSE